MKLFDRSRFVHQFFTGTEISKLAILVSTALLTMAMEEGFTSHPKSTFMLVALLGVATSTYFIAKRWDEIKPTRMTIEQSVRAEVEIGESKINGEKIILSNLFLVYFTLIVGVIYGMRDDFDYWYLVAFIAVISFSILAPFLALKHEHPASVLLMMAMPVTVLVLLI